MISLDYAVPSLVSFHDNHSAMQYVYVRWTVQCLAESQDLCVNTWHCFFNILMIWPLCFDNAELPLRVPKRHKVVIKRKPLLQIHPDGSSDSDFDSDCDSNKPSTIFSDDSQHFYGTHAPSPKSLELEGQGNLYCIFLAWCSVQFIVIHEMPQQMSSLIHTSVSVRLVCSPPPCYRELGQPAIPKISTPMVLLRMDACHLCHRYMWLVLPPFWNEAAKSQVATN